MRTDPRCQPRTVFTRAGTLVLILSLGLAGCGGKVSVDDKTLADVKAVYGEHLLWQDRLCVEAGPFPFIGGAEKRCDACQALSDAGLLRRRLLTPDMGGGVQYLLTDPGLALYREEADPRLVELVRRRRPSNQDSNNRFDPRRLGKPRLCFGEVRFHSIAAALLPFQNGMEHYRSVKVVAEAIDTSGMLFDPKLAALGIKVPPKPELGQPALYAPELITLQYYPGEALPELSSTRYGAWVNER